MATRGRLLILALLLMGMMGLRSTPAAFATPISIFVCPTTQSALTADITSVGAGGTVNFNCSTPTTIPFTSTIQVSQAVTLDGHNSQPVIFDGGGTVQLLAVGTGVNFILYGLTLTHGRAATQGGAIRSFGNVTIVDSTLSYNSAGGTGGGGGAISNWGTLALRNSTLIGNTATNGGALYNGGGNATIANSTLVANSGSSGGSVYNTSPYTVTVSGSILDNTETGSTTTNCNMGLTDGKYNLTKGWDPNSVFHNCGLTDATDLRGVNPDLKQLAWNGGPTQTRALAHNSRAVDYVPVSSGVCPATDQRGVTRPDDDEAFCDIGAYEHVDNLDIAVKVVAGQYSVYVDGGALEVGSTLTWRARTPAGDLTGSEAIATPVLHLLAYSRPCPSGHITVDASGRESTVAGINDVTAHYEGDPC